MPTSEEMQAAKQAQVNESVDRGGRKIDAAIARQANIDALDVVEDNNVPVDDVPSPTPRDRSATNSDEDTPSRPIRPTTEYDKRRADIIARFKQHRTEETEDTSDDATDIRRLTNDGLPPEMIAQEAPTPEPEPPSDDPVLEEDAAQPPPKRKLKVRGKEIEVTEEELIAHAQKALAGDDYLDEAKRKLDEVNQLYRDARTRVTSTTQPGQHPTAQNSATQQPEGDVTQPGEEGQHPTDPFARTVESVQLGTPEEAATQLRQTVEDAAAKAARQVLERERLRDEAGRSVRYLKDFQDKNQELAADPLAHAVLERNLYDLQAEDIRALGVDEAHLPKTPADIANWHMWYRANGYKVRPIPELLNTARENFNAWRGKSSDPKPTEPARQGDPRVVVSVDRAQRRAAIQPQPSRSAAPRTTTPSTPAPQRDRSDVVQQMIAARAKPRGKVMGT